MSEPINQRIGDYEILSELGAGGMGKVYKVRNVISDRIEAMKVLLPDLAGRQELATRFLREIKVLAALNHPNIAALRTALTLDNQLVMIMEYVEGTTLAQRIQQGPIPVANALTHIDQVLSALSYAHQQHVVHRDVKPANMMVTPQGLVKLMDFGIARSGDDSTLTNTGTTLGSLGYMSPEQVKGQPTDARSDLYSVGISLYEMVTGQRPFRENSDYSIMAAQVNQPPRPPIEIQPNLPPALNEIILVSIAKDPAARFQSADAFKNALTQVSPTAPIDRTMLAATATSIDSMPPTMSIPGMTASVTTPMTFAQPVARTQTQTAPPMPAAPQPSVHTPVMQAPPVTAQTQQRSSNKGLYMVLGGLVVVAALVAAGIYSRRAEAERDAASHSTVSTPAPQQATPPLQPAPQTATQPAAPDATAQPAQPAAEPAPNPPAHAHKKAAPDNGGQTAAPGGDTNANTQPAIDMDALEQEIDQVSNRAGAVNSSLDTLKAQQARSGYGLRGDMAARQESMKNNLQKAQEAITRGDGVRAKRYADLAASDAEALEHFLGR